MAENPDEFDHVDGDDTRDETFDLSDLDGVLRSIDSPRMFDDPSEWFNWDWDWDWGGESGGGGGGGDFFDSTLDSIGNLIGTGMVYIGVPVAILYGIGSLLSGAAQIPARVGPSAANGPGIVQQGERVLDVVEELIPAPGDFEQPAPSSSSDSDGLAPTEAIETQQPPTAPSAPVDISPRVIDQPQPDYPSRALDRGLEGKVVLEFTVSADGSVKDVVVVSSPSVFDRAAERAVERWRYHPRTLDRVPTDSRRIRAEITFDLPPE